MLQGAQACNQPEYIQRKAREKLEAEGFQLDGEDPPRKRVRPTSAESLERLSTASPLPELPEELRIKQVIFVSMELY